MTLEKEFLKHIQEAKERERQRVAKETRDNFVEILSAAYDKAMAYTNLIMIAGYVSFFTMWSFTREYLSKGQVLWSALIMTVSIVVFVSYEVLKMIVSSRTLLRFNRAISDPALQTDPDALASALAKHQNEVQEQTVWLGRFWHVILVVTITTALIAIGIVFYGMICGLIATYFPKAPA